MRVRLPFHRCLLVLLLSGAAGCGPRVPDAVAPIVDMLQHENGSTRMAACTALGQMGTAASPAIPFLLAALRDPDAGVRATAADALLAIGAREALPELQRALELENTPYVRLSLASALCGLGPEGIAAVADYVQRPEHTNIAGELCDILLRSGDPQAAVTAVDVAVTRGLRPGQGINLFGLTPSQQAALVAWLGETLTGHDKQAQAALLHSGHLRLFMADPQIRTWVGQLVTSDSERVRYGAVKSLADAAGNAWRELLTAAVDSAPRVRGKAMEALQPLSMPEVEQFFLGALHGPPLERNYAGRYFGARGNPIAIDALVEAQGAGERDQGLRELSSICDPRAADAFLALTAGDPDHVARFVLPYLHTLIVHCACAQPPCSPDALAPLISAEALVVALRRPGLMEAGLRARHRDLLNPWLALAGLVDSASSAALLGEAKRYLDGQETEGGMSNMEARVLLDYFAGRGAGQSLTVWVDEALNDASLAPESVAALLCGMLRRGAPGGEDGLLLLVQHQQDRAFQDAVQCLGEYGSLHAIAPLVELLQSETDQQHLILLSMAAGALLERHGRRVRSIEPSDLLEWWESQGGRAGWESTLEMVEAGGDP